MKHTLYNVKQASPENPSAVWTLGSPHVLCWVKASKIAKAGVEKNPKHREGNNCLLQRLVTGEVTGRRQFYTHVGGFNGVALCPVAG